MTGRLAAALLIGAQLLLGYWFYSYLTWFYPLLVVALIQPRPPTLGHLAPEWQLRPVPAEPDGSDAPSLPL